MRIDLEEPYLSIYYRGYLNVSSDGRKRVTFFDAELKAVANTSYARYLMSVKLGYIVPDHLDVDHVDNDFTNDDISNLQLLSKKENNLKRNLNYVENIQNCYGFACAYCDTNFLLTERQVKSKLAQGVEDAFCSHSCSASYHARVTKRIFVGQALSLEQVSRIKELRSSGLNSTQISDILGISKNTVTKYW